MWLLGVLPEEQREDLRVFIDAEYDSPVLDSQPEGLRSVRKRLDSFDSDVSTDSRSMMVCQSAYLLPHPVCLQFDLILHFTIRCLGIFDASLVDGLCREL